MANEKRLIDADELIKEVRRQAKIDPVTYPIISATLNAVAELADGLTIVDAVEVVRCKDCKHYLLPQGFCKHDRHDYQTMSVVQEDDDFCSYGERREENV